MSEQNNAVTTTKRVSLIETMAAEYNLDVQPFMDIVKNTIMPANTQGITNAHIAAFLAVAHQYNLNPLTKEIYAFPAKGGGIMPIVGVDGWLKIMLTSKDFGGYKYEEILEDGVLVGGQIYIYRRDLDHPIIHREWKSEAYRNTDPWNKMPRRMMENRTICQGVRRAFGIGGIMEPEEAEAMINITGESTVLERTTNDKAEALKEKIGAKRGRPTTAPKEPAAAPQPDPEPEPPTVPPTPEPVVEPEQAYEPEPAPQSGSFDFDDAPAVHQKAPPDGPISESERLAFMSILKTRFPEPEKQIPLTNTVKDELARLGCNNTRMILKSQYAGLVDWANTVIL